MATKPATSAPRRLPAFDFKALSEEFRNLNPNDPGTWPLIPRAFALLAILVAVVFAGWWFVWNDQLNELEKKGKEEGKFKQEYVDKKRQAVNLELYKQQLAEIDRSFGALLKQLPSKAEVESLLVEINQAGLGRGLQFELFKPSPEQIREFYAELPINVKINGSFHDFGAFAADIAKLPRIVTLNNIVITPQGSSGNLTLEAVTKTFRYLDEEELARNKREKEKEKAAKAKAGGKK